MYQYFNHPAFDLVSFRYVHLGEKKVGGGGSQVSVLIQWINLRLSKIDVWTSNELTISGCLLQANSQVDYHSSLFSKNVSRKESFETLVSKIPMSTAKTHTAAMVLKIKSIQSEQ